jgi:hypothetical protein
LPESFDDRPVNVFIGEEVHAAFSGGGFRSASAA